MRRATWLALLVAAASLLGSCAGPVDAPVDTTDEPSAGEDPAESPHDRDVEVRLHLLRHGEAVFNVRGILAGWADSPLTPTGAEQAARAGSALSEVPFVAAWTSDMVRTRDTATAVLAAHPGPPTLREDPVLREWHFGEFEGARNEDAAAVYLGGAENGWELTDIGMFADLIVAADPWGVADDRASVQQRATAALDTVLADALALGGGDVLVVTHGMAMLTMLAVIDPVSATTAVPGNVALSRVTWRDGVWTIEAQNDVGYLEPVGAPQS